MGAAQIRWDPGDSAGERTLTTVGSEGRFNGWRIQPAMIGERAVSVGDGLTHVWSHRTEYGVSFRFSVAEADQSLLNELLLWANVGGLFAIDTGDAEGNSYDEVCIAPGTLLDAGDPDPATLDIPVSASVINAAVTPSRMRQIVDGTGHLLATPVASLALTGFAPSVVIGTTAETDVGAAALTGFEPTVTV